MPDYENTFNARGDLYNAAARRCPDARMTERKILVDLLDLEEGVRICDIPAGGGYLADGLVREPNGRDVICVEPAPAFAFGMSSSLRRVIAPMALAPFREGSFDRLGSLAGLHHIDDRIPVFSEFYRLLAPGGKVAVADVGADTNAARFLNGPVDRWSETGHRGKFFAEGDLSRMLGAAGFRKTEESLKEYSWSFSSWKELVSYCRLLFGMVRATNDDVDRELQEVFDLQPSDGSARLPWSLVYATGIKR